MCCRYVDDAQPDNVDDGDDPPNSFVVHYDIPNKFI